MKIPFRSVLSPLPFALLLFAVTDGALAASPRLASHQVPTSLVTISITTTNKTVWGTVTATYTFQHRMTRRSCATATCKLRVPRGVMLHLDQVARDSATWPFKDWQVSANHVMKAMQASSTAIRVTGSMSVTAVYILAGTQSSSYGSGSYSP